MERFHRIFFIATLILFGTLSDSLSQCIVINEILVNPTGSDGTPPNSNEWFELLNTCNTPTDISCMIVGDGDFTLTIPSGTILQPGAVYTIGSGANGLVPDLNWNTCGCSSNAVVTGSLSDASEQLFVLDNTGNLISGVFWGTGAFPALVSSVSANGCNALTGITLLDDTGFDLIIVTEGTTSEQDCSGAWITSTDPSFGSTNSDQDPTAIASSDITVVCEGGAVNFDGSASLGTTYTWLFPNATPASSSDVSPSGIVFNSFGTQTVELSVQNSCGQASIATVSIQVEQPLLPTIAASTSTTICESESLTLSTSAAGTYQWRLDGNDLAGENNSSIDVIESGSYTVLVNNGVCTVESLPTLVSITPLPVAALLTTDTEVCVDENLLIEAAPGFSGYQWIENGVVISTLANYAVITSNPGTFNLELTANNNGCTSAPLPITVIVHPFPVVQITPSGPLELCPDDEVVLNSVNTHQTYQWYEDGAPTATTATLNVAYQQATTITLEATDNGCTSSGNIVSVVSNEVANIATWNPPPYAENNTLSTCLDAHPLLGVSDGAVIQWFRNGSAIPGENGLIVNATADGDYYFTASITGQCAIYSDTITVDLEVDMSIETTASKDTACEGEIVQIIPQGNFVSYSWSGGIIADTLDVSNSGTYIVTGHLVSCFKTDTVEVFFSPYPMMSAGDDFYSDCGENTMLYGQSDGDETYWEIDGYEVASGDTSAIATPTRTTELVMISSLNGCESRDTVNLIIDCVYIYAPTAITPDGDGLNDVFRVYANGLSTFTLRIFDRYGQVVWETNDPEGVWTGGSPDYYVPNGVYTWQIEALDYNQEEAISKARGRGSILVIR